MVREFLAQRWHNIMKEHIYVFDEILITSKLLLLCHMSVTLSCFNNNNLLNYFKLHLFY